MTKIATMSSATVAAAGIGLLGAPTAHGEPTTQTLGTQGKLTDGPVVQGWTIDNLKPSTDVIPHPVAGALWEATANDQAIQGSVTPIVSNLNARAANGQTYRALFGAATPQGVNPSTIAQGQQTTGKVYFDVTGATPDSVVYNAAGQDLLIWTQPPASSAPSGSSSTSYGQGYYSSPQPTTAAPAEAPPAEAPDGTAAAPAATGAAMPLPEGSQGTPLPEGSQGTPLPASTPGTPPSAGSQGTPIAPEQAPQAAAAPSAPAAPVPPAPVAPAPANIEATPQPAGSEGTPLPADEVAPPTIYLPTP